MGRRSPKDLLRVPRDVLDAARALRSALEVARGAGCRALHVRVSDEIVLSGWPAHRPQGADRTTVKGVTYETVPGDGDRWGLVDELIEARAEIRRLRGDGA